MQALKNIVINGAMILALLFGLTAADYATIKGLAERGDPEAQYDLAVIYGTGYGVSQDDTKAFQWARKSANQGNADAQYSLGHMYANGNGVNKNKIQAQEWFGRACDSGDQYKYLNLE